MMRSQNLVLCAVGALAAAALAFSGPAPTSAASQESAEVRALTMKVEALEKKLEAFTEAQADAGDALMDAIARSEAEGFTAGINPKSREVLLDGLRAQAKAMKAGAGKDAKKATPTKRLRGDRARRTDGR